MAADYLAFAYALEPGAAGAARDAAQALTDVGWVLRWRRPGLEVWTQGRPEIPVSGDPAGTTVIIGHRFDGSESAASDADDPRAATSALSNARRLIGQSWGAYVALLRDPTGASWILRDPTGAHDALTWTREGLALVASDIALAPARLRPRHLSLDWDVITDFVRRPVSTSARSPLTGLHAVAPGDLHPLGEGPDRAVACWRPQTWARRARRLDPQAPEQLKRAVETAVNRTFAAYERCLVEVSGGLDSAVVALTADRLGWGGKVAGVLHFYGDRREADERSWAQLVRDRLGCWTPDQPLALPALEEADFAIFSERARPTLNALDLNRDRATAHMAQALSADVLVTGKGGDAVFFQHPTAMLLADHLAACGLRHAFGRVARDVARRLRRSVWSVAFEACGMIGRRRAGEEPPSPLLGARARATPQGPAHPWLTDLAGLPPGKRYQLEGLALTQVHRGASRYGGLVDVVHPLMAQPVLEAALAIPTWELARGGRDRGLERALFADRVPPEILNRQSKAEMSSFYARTVAANLPFLRGYLLDGCLCDAEVLDRVALERALREDALIQAPDSTAVLSAAAIEAWIRHWQARVPDGRLARRAES